MTTLVTVLTPGFADWETALLNGTARVELGLNTRYGSPGGTPVTSLGGLTVTPDIALENLDPNELDALIICGGSVWSTADAPDIAPIAAKVLQAGKPVAAICDAVVMLAKAGILDTLRHTGNWKPQLEETGYKGAEFFQETPSAVRDGQVITAAGTAPVSFMVEVLQAVGISPDTTGEFARYYGAEHRPAQ